MNVNIEKYLSEGTLKDLQFALKSIPTGRSLRLARIPVLDFSAAMEKAFVHNKYIPFRPVIFNNIPIDMTENALPEFIIVADDNTNISRTAIKETEFYKGEIIG